MRAKTFIAMALLGLAGKASAAGIPVVDASNLAQAIQQLQQMHQQYQTMQSQLESDRKRYGAITGNNDMAHAINSKYWENWDQLDGDALSKKYGLEHPNNDHFNQGTIDSNRTVSGTQAKQTEAVNQMLQAAQARFVKINQLIQKIDSSDDLKTVADLQARIQGEQALLQNDMLKTQLLQQHYQMQRQTHAMQVSNTKPASLLDAQGGN